MALFTIHIRHKANIMSYISAIFIKIHMNLSYLSMLFEIESTSRNPSPWPYSVLIINWDRDNLSGKDE